jgi:hypothetical protein
MSIRLRFAFISMAVMTVVRAGHAAVENPPALGALRAGVEARDAAIRNLGFRATFHFRSPKNRVRGAAVVSQIQVLDVILDTSGGRFDTNRARVDMLQSLSEEDAKNIPKGNPVEVASDGTKMVRSLSVVNEHGSQMLETVRDGIRLGWVHRENGLFWFITPIELLNLNYFSPARPMTPRSIERVDGLGMESVDDREAVRLTWSVDKPDGDALRGTYWIAPGLGYAVVRETMERRLKDPASPWREIVRKEGAGFDHVGGVWLPGRVSSTRHHYYDTGEYEFGEELVAEFEKWAVNVPITDATFRLDFPDGTWVKDYTRGGEKYVKGKVDDRRVIKDVARAREIARADRPKPDMVRRFDQATRSVPFARDDRRSWLIGAACVLLVLVGMGSWRLARQRKGTRP